MRRKRWIWSVYFLLCLILIELPNKIFPRNNSDGSQQYRLRESLRIGDTLDTQPNNILVRPRQVVCDKAGRVWIADEAILCVKVFDRSRNCLVTIGRKGQGPEEFQSITAMTINFQGDLVIVDYLNARIAVFSSLGRHVATYRLPTNVLQWPRRIVCSLDSGYIFLAKHANNNLMFHHFTKDFRYVKSFGELPIIDQQSARFEARFAEFEPGEITVDAQGILYYAPGLFDGRIYLYKNYKLWSILAAKTNVKLPYEYKKVEKLGPGPPPSKYQYSMGGRSGMYYARRNLASGGVNILDDGTIAHLLVTFNEEKYTTGVQFFTPNGSRFEYIQLAGEEMPDYAWSASAGKWYLINRLGIPQVIEYVLQRVK